MFAERRHRRIAQLMGFLSEADFGYPDRDTLYDRLVFFATRAAFLGLNFSADEKYVGRLADWYEEVELGTKISLFSAKEYRQHLKSWGVEKRRIISYMVEKTLAYKQYEPKVKLFLEQLKQLENSKDHPDHIAQDVFNIKLNGKDYVIKIRHMRNVSDYLMGTSYIAGEDHFEQIVAASFEDGVIISEKIPGKQFDQLSAEEVMSISDEQICRGFKSLLQAQDRRLPMENKSKNIMYDHEEGFGFIDFISFFSAIEDNEGASDLLDYYFIPLFRIIVHSVGIPFWLITNNRQSIKDYILGCQRELAMIDRMKPIVLELLTSPEDKARMAKVMDDDCDYFTQEIKAYQDEKFLIEKFGEIEE